jgi:hypothetical protein
VIGTGGGPGRRGGELCIQVIQPPARGAAWSLRLRICHRFSTLSLISRA